MISIKQIINKNISLKHAVEWCSLVGIDEVIQDVPRNHLIPPMKLSPVKEPSIAMQKPSDSSENIDISFDSCTTLDELEKAALNMTTYKTLSKTASYMLFGDGRSNAKVMIIADQPGREEDLSNQLFSSEKGQLIRSIIRFSGFNEDDIYYTYLSKWRPPGGRKLSEIEQKNLSNLLKKQVNIIMPQIIVTLGEIALHSLIPKTGFNFRKNSGKLHIVDNEAFGTKITFLPLFHEESLLKTPQLKKATWLSIVNCKGDLIRQ